MENKIAKPMTLDIYYQRMTEIESHTGLDARGKVEALEGIENTTQTFLLFEIRDLLLEINRASSH